jgi:hypothetical protein
MAIKKPSAIAPSISPHRAIDLLQERLADCERIRTLPRGNPDVLKWETTTEGILNAAFGTPEGQPHSMTTKFFHAGSFPVQRAGFSGRGGTPDHVLQHHHELRTDQRKAILESSIEQLQILAPPAASVAVGQYRFHAEIERVSGDLFRDGHYTQAALAAFIRVIDEVKRRSRVNLDGDALMNHAFGSDNRTPVLKLNDLSNPAENDEQKGFMFLFSLVGGICG